MVRLCLPICALVTIVTIVLLKVTCLATVTSTLTVDSLLFDGCLGYWNNQAERPGSFTLWPATQQEISFCFSVQDASAQADCHAMAFGLGQICHPT